MKDDSGQIQIPTMQVEPDFPTYNGIPLRDWFAGMALANPAIMAISTFNESDCEAIARRASCIADAMIKQRER